MFNTFSDVALSSSYAKFCWLISRVQLHLTYRPRISEVSGREVGKSLYNPDCPIFHFTISLAVFDIV